jgi:hypothetical protein
MLERLFPKQLDNRYDGQRAALWLLGLFVFMKLAMSLNIIFNTEEVAVGADGFRLASYGPDGARAVLMLFARMALSQLAIALIALTVLVRYRALVPFTCLLLIVEHLAGRAIVQSYAVPRADTGGTGLYVNAAILTLLGLALALSLWPRAPRKRLAVEHERTRA